MSRSVYFVSKIENTLSLEQIGKVLDAHMEVTVGEFLGASPTARAFINDMTKLRTVQPEEAVLLPSSKVNLARLPVGIYASPTVDEPVSYLHQPNISGQLQMCYFYIRGPLYQSSRYWS